jgi:hypothetical protein
MELNGWRFGATECGALQGKSGKRPAWLHPERNFFAFGFLALPAPHGLPCPENVSRAV